jgi:hypothetical protein
LLDLFLCNYFWIKINFQTKLKAQWKHFIIH